MKVCHIIIGIFLVGSLPLCGCYRNDVRETEIPVPQMRTAAAADYLMGLLQHHPGVLAVEADHYRGVIDVIYDSKHLARRNLEIIIVEAGFDAAHLRADPEAARRLPAEFER